ncbi:MAG: 2TM domain-containing protein [Anaerolineae bacterium]|nr:2TM domain-containing protein [Anaerolineae bacterium]
MLDEQELRKRVEKRIKDLNEFWVHLAVFIAAMAGLWIFYGFTGGDFPWPLIPMLGWGIGIVAHAATVYANSPARLAAHERRVQREVELERQRLEAAGVIVEKAKRDADDETRYRLSDDGEIIEDEVEEEEPQHKRSR